MKTTTIQLFVCNKGGLYVEGSHEQFACRNYTEFLNIPAQHEWARLIFTISTHPFEHSTPIKFYHGYFGNIKIIVNEVTRAIYLALREFLLDLIPSNSIQTLHFTLTKQ